MKKLLLIPIFFLVCNSYAQEKVFPITQTNQRFVTVDEKLYVDKFEVTVYDYITFLNEIRKSGKDVSLLIYDSICWRDYGPFNREKEDYYYNYSSYKNYPIVGISHFAAQEFCKWLTEKYNADPNREFKKVVFRLPTEQEFVKVARSKFDTIIFYPWGYNSLYNSKREKCCNFLEIDQINIDFKENGFDIKEYNDFFSMTEPVYSYQPNPFGIYNIVGNVSEMIQENHYAMGGDYLSTGYNVRIKSKKKYSEPTSSIGFRVYMEILN